MPIFSLHSLFDECSLLGKVFSILKDMGISVDVVATSEVSVSLTLDPTKVWNKERISQASVQ